MDITIGHIVRLTMSAECGITTSNVNQFPKFMIRKYVTWFPVKMTGFPENVTWFPKQRIWFFLKSETLFSGNWASCSGNWVTFCPEVYP